MHGEGIGGVEGQQRKANRVGDPIQLGVQDQSALIWTPRQYTELDLDVLYMVGTEISYNKP